MNEIKTDLRERVSEALVNLTLERTQAFLLMQSLKESLRLAESPFIEIPSVSDRLSKAHSVMSGLIDALEVDLMTEANLEAIRLGSTTSEVLCAALFKADEIRVGPHREAALERFRKLLNRACCKSQVGEPHVEPCSAGLAVVPLDSPEEQA